MKSSPAKRRRPDGAAHRPANVPLPFPSGRSATRALWLLCYLLLCGLAAWRLIDHGLAHLVRQGAFSPGGRIPIPTRPDAFFYLGAARDLLAAPAHGILPAAEAGSFLLARLTAWCAGAFPLEYVALLLPVLLSLSMVPAILPWMGTARQNVAAPAAAVLGLCAPYWLERTQLGALDTDTLIPFLLSAALFCLHLAARGKGGRRLAALTGAAACAVLLHFWWLPGPSLLLLPTGYWLVRSLFELRRRSARLFALGALLLGAALCGVGVLAHAALADGVRFAVEHFRLVLGLGAQSLERASIIELSPFRLRECLEQSLGLWYLVPLPLLGVWFWCRRFRGDAPYLLYLLALGAGGLLARRFLTFGIPALAVLTICGAAQLSAWAARLGTSRPLRVLLFALVVVLPVLPNLRAAWDHVPDPYYSAADVAACERIERSFPARAFVWTWWDYGYFVHYLTRRPVFFHGGSQDPARLFTAAYPLMQPDGALAARWLRCYAQLRRPAVPPSDTDRAAALRTLEDHVRAARPTRQRVALYLPRRTFDASGYLYALAFALPREQVVNRLDLFPARGFSFAMQDGSVGIPQDVFDKGYRGFGSLLDTGGRSVPAATLDALADPILVHADALSYVAITDRPFIRTTLFHLLGFFGPTPGFRPVWFDPEQGGLWEVLDVRTAGTAEGGAS